MPALNFLHILALASIAIVALTGPAPVNALVADRAQVARHIHAHDAIARRKRDNSATSRCKTRPSTPTSTPPPSTSSAPPPATYSPPPASTTSSAPSTAPTGSSSNAGVKKWGLAWGQDTALSKFALPKVDTYYTWNADPAYDAGNTALNFCPMLWGYSKMGDFDNVVSSGQYKCVMGMNEVNQPGQANLSPQDAYNLWMGHINHLKDKGYYLVSPSCTNDQAGLDWFKEFFSLCQSSSGCHVDAINYHCYTPTAQPCIDFGNKVHAAYGLPVWITEFAAQDFTGGAEPDMSQVWDYAGKMRDFVDNTPWVGKAFPFGALNDLQGVDQNNALMDASGNPNSLAHFYFG